MFPEHAAPLSDAPPRTAAADAIDALPPDHLVRVLIGEQERFLRLLETLEGAVRKLDTRRSREEAGAELLSLRRRVDELLTADLQHIRQERVVFAKLVDRGVVTAPMNMEREHELLRSQEARILSLVTSSAADLGTLKRQLEAILHPLAELLREHVYKVSTVLYPCALRVIADDDVWEKMRADCDAIGYWRSETQKLSRAKLA